MSKSNYNCFSYNQMKFLVDGGESFLKRMTHSTTGNMFWIFERTENFDRLLFEYAKESIKYKR